jgi:hypothetical protein
MDEAIQVLSNYCGALAYRKLRFIANNDHGIDVEDIKTELIAEGIAGMMHVDWSSNKAYVLNYAKRASHNYMVRLIEHHTAKKRSRIIRVVEGDDETMPEYSITTLSLDYEMTEGGFTLKNIIGDNSFGNAEHKFGYRQWLSKMMTCIPQNIGHVVMIVLGGEHDGFEGWLDTQYHISIEDLEEDTLVNLACAYFKAPIETVQEALSSFIKRPDCRAVASA